MGTRWTAARHGSALRAISIGCLGVLILGLVLLAMTVGYFGPGLPQKDYELEHRRFVEQQSGLSAEEIARAEQFIEEIETLLDQHVWPILHTEDFTLGGKELDDPDLPQDQREAIAEAVAALEEHGVNELLDGIITLRYVPPGRNGEVRALARLQMGAMRLAWAQGDADGVRRAYGRLRGLANAQANSGFTTIDRMVAVGVDMLALSTVRDLLSERTADETMLDTIADAHERAERTIAEDGTPWPDLKSVFEGERILLRADLLAEGFDVPIRAMNPGAADRDIARVHERAIEAWSLTGLDRIEALRDDYENDAWSFDTGPIAGILVPAYGLFLASELIRQAEHRATTLTIAIERFNLENGRPPAMLEELVPDRLSAIPLDPVTNEPFRYVIDDASPLGYRLYSVGFDGVDNRGTLSERDRRGFDFEARASDHVFMPATDD